MSLCESLPSESDTDDGNLGLPSLEDEMNYNPYFSEVSYVYFFGNDNIERYNADIIDIEGSECGLHKCDNSTDLQNQTEEIPCNSLDSNANMLTTYISNASELKYEDRMLYDKINQKQIQQNELPSLPESSFERKIKRKLETNESQSKIKKYKTCKSINSRYKCGERIDKKMELSDEDIEEFKKLENTKLKCSCCGKNKSITKIFKVDDFDICCEECVKERKIDLIRLKSDIFEDYNYDGQMLYKCCRLEHARPLSHYTKYSKRNKSYRVVTNCCYCRLYKSQENELKKK